MIRLFPHPMLSLSQFQIKTQHHFISPAFSLTLALPGNYLLAGRNGSGKSLLLAALANNGTPMAGVRECKVSIAQVSIEMQQQLIAEEKQKTVQIYLMSLPPPPKYQSYWSKAPSMSSVLQKTPITPNILCMKN